jgi:hypothetical protein
MLALGRFISVPLTSFPRSSNGIIVETLLLPDASLFTEAVDPPFRFFEEGVLLASCEDRL